jgi:hypothetical protein
MRVLRYRRLGLGAAVLAGLLGVGAALAQPAGPTFPECTKKASKDDTEAAKNAHRVATQFYDRADYDKAIQYWTDSWKFDCSANDLLINIANAYEKKGDRAATVATLEAYLKRTPPNPTLEEKVKNLKALLAPPPPVTATASVAPPPPPTTATVQPPPAVPPDGARPYGVKPWFLVGGGGALAIVGAILLPVGLGNVSSANSACPTRTGCSQSVADQGNSGRTQSGAGGALLGIGLAAAGGGLVWQFGFNKAAPAGAPPAGAGAAPAPGAAHSLWVLPGAGPGVSGVTAGGSF